MPLDTKSMCFSSDPSICCWGGCCPGWDGSMGSRGGLGPGLLAVSMSASTGVSFNPPAPALLSVSLPLPATPSRGWTPGAGAPEQVWPGKAVPGDKQHQRGWDSGPDPATGPHCSPPSKQGHQRQQQPMAGGHWRYMGLQGALPHPLGKPPNESQWGDMGALVSGVWLCRSRMGMNIGELGGLGDIARLVWCMRC